MITAPVPTFGEWVDDCFTRGHSDSESPDDADKERWKRFVNLDPPLVAGFIVRLFQQPEFVADGYTDNQIGQGVSFLFSSASEYFFTVRDKAVEPALQVKCFRSVESMYLQLFDRVCCNRGTDPDGDYYDREESCLDGAVYMIWDRGCIEAAAMYPKEGTRGFVVGVAGDCCVEGAAFNPKKSAMLVEPCLDVLETVLRRCRTSTCRLSALHGMGHLFLHFADCRKDPKNPFALRVQRAVEAFLERQDVPDWLREYALQARDGRAQ